MPFIQNTETGETLAVAQEPRLVDGIWECGDQRFTDLDGTLYKPVPAPPLTWANAPEQYWWVDVGPFFDRFGDKAIVVTSADDSVVRGMLTLITPRAYVDLKRPDLPGLLEILVAKQLITADDATRILATPTTDYERHVKGLPQPEDA